MGEVVSMTLDGINAAIAAALENAGLSEAEVQALVDAGLANLVDASPATLDTLNELAAALADDPNFAATVTARLAGAMGVVIHGAVAGTARPAGYGAIHWIGSVAPNNMIDNDLWTDTSA